MSSNSAIVTAGTLQSFVAALFRARGVPEAAAARVAECLVQADLRGVSSHGVGRVPIYLERLRRGLVNPKPALTLEEATPAAARLDADNGLGFVVATRGMDEAIARAKACGIGLVFA